MGKRILVYILFFASKIFISQNLVPNGNFEAINVCPSAYNQVTACATWSPSFNNNNPLYHSEYMNACNGGLFNVPNGTWGFQNAHSGVGYMATVMMAPTVQTDYRENIYTKLTTTLTAGTTYSVTFYVSHTDNSQNSTNNIGVKFSKVPSFLINNISHVYTSTVITDNINWTKISGAFTADSAYQYICIGNFFTDANTTTNVSCGSCSYNLHGYFIDDISVTTISVPLTSTFSIASNNICVGQTVNFNNTSGGASTYTWSFGDGGASNVLNPTYTYTSNGTYTVSLTTSNGTTTATSTNTIIVNPKPNVTALANSTVCINTSTLLIASGANGYLWSPATSLSSSSGATVTSTPTVTTTYTVIGTNSFGCKDTDNVTVTVIQLPNVSINGNTNLCQGKTTTINATGNASQYNWSTGAISNSIILSPAVTTNYSVTGTNLFGCSASLFFTIVVTPNPVLAITPDTTICFGQTVTLISSGSVAQYLWNTSSTTNSISVTPTVSTSYSVIGTNSFGCNDTAYVMVNVNALPSLGITGDSIICLGQTVTLISSGNGTQMNWSTGQTSTSINVSPTLTTVYTLVAKKNNCTTAKEFTVDVVSKTNATFTLTVDTCASSITADPLFLTTLFHDWNFGTGDHSNLSSISYNYQNPGNYIVTHITNPNTICADTSSQTLKIIGFYFEIDNAANVFTPNGDDINDVFKFQNLNSCEDYTLDVFDKWGLKMFSAFNAKTQFWDGHTTSGMPVSSGVYFYILESNKHKYKGYITLLR